jgi:hypothetical protein
MILRTNSRLLSLLCYCHPMLIDMDYHDDAHVKVTFDIDAMIGLVSIAVLFTFILIELMTWR